MSCFYLVQCNRCAACYCSIVIGSFRVISEFEHSETGPVGIRLVADVDSVDCWFIVNEEK